MAKLIEIKKPDLPDEIQDKLEKIYLLNQELETLKGEVTDYFDEVLLYDLDDGENYDLQRSLDPIFDGDVGDFGDGLDEAIGMVIEMFGVCEFKEGTVNEM